MQYCRNTRLAKLDDPQGEYTAIVLAAAGLIRLGFSNRISSHLLPPTLFPAVGQAALALEIRADDTVTRDLIAGLTHYETDLTCRAERSCLRVLEGGCSVPVGVSSTFVKNEGAAGGRLSVIGTVTSLAGTSHVQALEEATVVSAAEAEALGQRLAQNLLQMGARDILDEIEAAKKAKATVATEPEQLPR